MPLIPLANCFVQSTGFPHASIRVIRSICAIRDTSCCSSCSRFPWRPVHQSTTTDRPLREAKAFLSPTRFTRSRRRPVCWCPADRALREPPVFSLEPNHNPSFLYFRCPLRLCVSARECCCSCSCLLPFIHHRFPTSARSTSLFSRRGAEALRVLRVSFFEAIDTPCDPGFHQGFAKIEQIPKFAPG